MVEINMNKLQLTLYVLVQGFIFVMCEEDMHSNQRLFGKFDLEKSGEFVDPYAFHYDRYNKKMTYELSSGEEYETRVGFTEDKSCRLELQKCRNLINDNILGEVFSRRLINLLLSTAILKEDDDTISGNIYIRATSSQMEILRNFGDGKISMRQLDSILSEVIVVPKTNIFKEAITITELLVTFVREHKGTCVILLGAFYAIETIRRTRWSARKIFLVTLVIMFIVSFFMTWWQLIKEAEIKLVANQAKYLKEPIQCRPEETTIYTFIVSRFEPDACEKYYTAVMTDPVLQVTPMLVLSHLTSKCVLHPVTIIGEAVGNFVEKATANLSFPMRWTVTLFLFVGVVMLMVVLPFCLCGGSLGFGCGPLFHFSLSGRSSEKKETLKIKLGPERIETIYEAVHDVVRKEIEASLQKEIKQKDNLALVKHDDFVTGDIDGKDTEKIKEVSYDKRHTESEGKNKVDCERKHNEEIGSGDS